MTDLAVIVPSRGRPQRMAELADAITEKSTVDVHLVVCLDDDDKWHATYLADLDQRDNVRILHGPRKSLSAWTNYAAKRVLDTDNPHYLASLGDDHRPRTHGWDARLIDAIQALGRPGMAYGNDLLQGRNLPTAWLMSASIVEALGWMMLPECEHMYVDAAMLALAQAADCARYRPDVIIEHLHPLAGKTQWDESYRESNSPMRYAADETAFAVWKAERLAADAQRILQIGG